MSADVPLEILMGPDPVGARVRFERFVERGGVAPDDGPGRRLLAALLSSGTLLPELLLADVQAWPALAADPWLHRPKPASRIFGEVEAATRGAADFVDLKRRLRLFHRGELLRLGARELGWGTTEEVAGELSGLADAYLELSYRFCDGRLRRMYGEPTRDGDVGAGEVADADADAGAGAGPVTTLGGSDADVDSGPPSFVVMAMGKLGGEELNFSSDVDLIYFYATDVGRLVRREAPGEGTGQAIRTGHAWSLHQYYVELSRQLTEALDDVTAEGFLFRVDLRLRPEGRGGPLCNSMVATERYYETFGRTWERQALLRARPCAGDLALGRRILAMLDPFIYPRHIVPAMMQEIRSLRAQFRPKNDPRDDPASDGEREGDRRRAGAAAGFDVKLGSGGIRDVELVVQTLQLLHGGQRRDLRGQSTPRGLRRMEISGLLTDREARTLAAAYRFWRQVEHRLQLQDGAQTQLIPADAERRTLFARRLGFLELAALDGAVATRRAEVSEIVVTLGMVSPAGPGAPEADQLAKVLRLLGLSLDRSEITALLSELGFVDLEASADLIETVGARLPPAVVLEAAASPDPDRALGNFRDLVLRGSVGLGAWLRDHPQLLRMLATLFGVSERLSRLLVTHPEMWEPLVDGLGEPRRSARALLEELDLRLRLSAPAPSSLSASSSSDPIEAAQGELEDPDEAMARALRRNAHAEILRIGMHDVAGNLTPVEVTAQLTDLAEVSLQRGVPRILDEVAARHGAPSTSFTILGLGSLGAREMRYGSDLDLVFLYADEGHTSAGVGHQELFSRLARRLMSFFGAILEEGRLYDIDTRLRPSGAQGLLVTSQAAFERYHRQEAAGWERVALLRARVVFTTAPPEERAAFERTLERITYQQRWDDEKFGRELRRMRARVEAERGRVPPGSRHLRFDPGGIMDVEFLSALGQLAGGAADPALRTTETSTALARLIATGWPPSLLSDQALLRRLALRMRLLRDRHEDVIGPSDLLPLARSLEQEPARLMQELDAAMLRIRAFFLERFP
jgi:glutamate-ammonia-ligase adenylyltransferase